VPPPGRRLWEPSWEQGSQPQEAQQEQEELVVWDAWSVVPGGLLGLITPAGPMGPLQFAGPFIHKFGLPNAQFHF